MVCQKLGFPLVLFVPNYHSSQQSRILSSGKRSGKADYLVGKNIAVLRYGAILYDFVSGISFKPGDKEYLGSIPLPKEIEITVCPVDGNNTAGRKNKVIGSFNVSNLAIGNYSELR